MKAHVGYLNGFRALKALQQAINDPRIEEIEGGALDDGRVFLHARAGYVFDGYESRTKSVGSAADVRDALKLLREETK